MPAKGPVKIIWQIVFTFIPILDLWAFYRIKKLRRFFLYVVIPSIVIMMVFVAAILANTDFSKLDDPTFDPFMTDEPAMLAMNIASPIIEIGFQILSIYLVYTWSQKWNRQFQTSGSDF